MANLSNINNKFIVESDGDVGIGVTTALDKLNVGDGNIRISQAGDVASQLILNTYQSALGNSLYNWFLQQTTSTNSYSFQIGMGSTPYLHINSVLFGAAAGNVGIGNTNPTYQLDVLGSGGLGGIIHIKNTDAQQYPRLAIQSDVKGYHIGVGGSGAGAGYANNLYFYDNNEAAVRMVIDTNGNVGIGVTPSATYTGYRALDIGLSGQLFSNASGGDSVSLVFNAYLNTGASAWVRKQASAASFLNQSDNGLQFYTAPSDSAGTNATFTERMRISSLGVVSVGTTSPITDPFVSSNQFQQFQVGKSGVMGSYTTVAQEAMFSNNMYVGSTYNTFQALDTSVNATAMFLYNDYIAFKCGTTAANGTVTALEQMRISNTGELNIGGHGGQFPVLKVVGLAGGVHIGSTWSINANQDGIGRTILGTGGQGRAMYFENDGKTVHTEESSFYKGVYLGGGVAANLLDDYEEGTFYATTNNDGVGAQVISRYTKIGQLVTYTVYFPSWSPTAAGTAIIAGFPFTAITSYGYGVGNVTHSTGVLNCSGGYHAGTAWNGTQNNSTGRSSWVVASARSIMVTGFYYTAS